MDFRGNQVNAPQLWKVQNINEPPEEVAMIQNVSRRPAERNIFSPAAPRGAPTGTVYSSTAVACVKRCTAEMSLNVAHKDAGDPQSHRVEANGNSIFCSLDDVSPTDREPQHTLSRAGGHGCLPENDGLRPRDEAECTLDRSLFMRVSPKYSRWFPEAFPVQVAPWKDRTAMKSVC
ncbi:hypothetical protein EYF80_021036 [Liparis tanakae]|uniref:Uncharacterized protein n=1 Tax=Liparis tanakae TaxID=230148 RepID=A0A4Z2HUN7_9TELE|nr:hypothetical protein EYF80_021036 [Liparis tanakae]